MKKNILAFILLISISFPAFSQRASHAMSAQESLLMPSYLQQVNSSAKTNAVTPPSSPVRTIGEWEELQGLLITWTSYQSMLREIVRWAKLETRVYIVTQNQTSVISYLNAGGVDTVNVTFMNTPYNTVWSRDYGPWSAYTNDVDTLITIDWIYNRPRPLDDVIPVAVATQLGTPLYQTTTSPNNLIHTGGNFMCDGRGTGFSSNLIVNENPTHTIAEIDTIMKHFMGIDRYIKMSTLPYDNIHHIDMHMKLLDEETLMLGQYPAGIADGPQIEANLQFVLTNYMSCFGTPYNIVRIPMPDDNGLYPNNGGNYFTYTNSSFINKTIIVPQYSIAADTTALRIYRDALPGYNVVGINSNASITALGALHCITKELGTSDPLLISHKKLPDTYDTLNAYNVVAFIKHRTGILNADLYWRTDTVMPYQTIAMSQIAGTDNWTVAIPAQPVGTAIYYYIHAQANSGKQQVRPMPAPQGYWLFHVLGTTGISEIAGNEIHFQNIFPNPAQAITCIPVYTNASVKMQITLCDITGRFVKEIFNGQAHTGDNKFFFDASLLAQGVYVVELNANNQSYRQKVAVR
jgi:agmatine/peptidylarginine deiminase